MTRRGSRASATHVQRVAPLYDDPEKERDFLMRRHQMLRRAAGFMLAKKYRTPWYAGPSTPHSETLLPKTVRTNSAQPRKTKDRGVRPKSPSPAASTPAPPGTLGVLSKLRGYTREELINFWKDLPPVAKRALLRIHRDVYIAALDQYLVRQNLCCECHDNVIAEWEDLERRRSGSRSLQDVFSVFPPFLDEDDDDDEDDDEEDDEEEEEEEEEDDESGEEGGHCRHHHHRHHHDVDDDLLEHQSELIDDEDEVVFDYELEGDQFRRKAARRSGAHGSVDEALLSNEYLAALEVGKRQEDELLRLIQKEERYIIIREDHSEFIMDLIRCGEQFSSYVAALRPLPSYDDNGYDDEDDDAECPGANTSHLAQEYLLEVLAIKFREQLESAYQAALQHSLAVQAELLREEIAELQRDQKQQQQQQSTAPSKSKKKKEKKKKKKKADATSKGPSKPQPSNQPNSQPTQVADNQIEATPTSEPSPVKNATSRRDRSSSASASAAKKARSNQPLSDELSGSDNQKEEEDEEEQGFEFDAVDREVEEFRLLLEKINSQQTPRKSKPKLVLPPGAFSLAM